MRFLPSFVALAFPLSAFALDLLPVPTNDNDGWSGKTFIADSRFQGRPLPYSRSRKDDDRRRPGSPAEKIGFKPIPVEKIGPYSDERRASWPIIEATGARSA